MVLYFLSEEKRLLNRLQQMLDCAIDGELERTEISEEKYSALENSMKQYLDSNFLARKNQQEQKEVIQKLIFRHCTSDIDSCFKFEDLWGNTL